MTELGLQVLDPEQHVGEGLEKTEGNLAGLQALHEIGEEVQIVRAGVIGRGNHCARPGLRSCDKPRGEPILADGPPIATINAESHDRHFAVNSRAVAMLMSTFARRIIERKTQWGRIINISADCAWGCPKEISYRASKYALESYSRSAAAELGPYGITVNVVSPGPVQSGYITAEIEQMLIPDIPLRRVGQPEDIANAVIFFASEQAGWITGQVIFVHGGHRMAFGQ